MKSILPFLLCFPIFLFGQDKSFNNEIGIETTSLWKQIIGSSNLNQNDYYLTYRHYFGGFNLNLGTGVAYSKSFSDEIGQPTEDNTQLRINRQLNFRIGIERMKPLRKRLNYFYGVFYTQSFLYDYNDRQRVLGGFAIIQTINIAQLGLAPYLGLRYNISDRIGIETSSMFNIYSEQNRTIQTSRFVGPITGNPPENFTIQKFSWNISNELPIFLILTIRI